ncbi:PQQ-like beta-propeller repeat protein [Rubripirellula amarantea]|nr:PQQ-like beta-propeller repeat protein [Rubripirellula amarantea]
MLSLAWIVHSMIACSMIACSMIDVADASAEDWPGWMGASRDGVISDEGLLTEIPESGLEVKWRTPIAGGYAGPAVADGRVFVFDYLKEKGESFNNPGERANVYGKERLIALDEKTGKELWKHEYDCPYNISYPAGPRCTPTVDGDRVYTLGSEGDFRCLNVADGNLIWKRNLKTDFSAEVPIWGFASHPLVEGDLVYIMVGGEAQSIVAFDKQSGEVRWKALDGKAGYCPPSLVELGGKRQLIVFNPEGVHSLKPSDGSVHWSVPITPEYEMSIARPMVEGNRVYASGIRTESLMIEVADDSESAKELWRGESKDAVHSANSTPMFVDGVIYGTDCNNGNLVAVDGTDGTILWSTFEATRPGEKRFIRHGTAFLTRLGNTDRYLLMSEMGDLIMAKLTKEGFEDLGRFHAIEPTGECFGRKVVWSHPAYANKTAFMRNDEEIVAVSIAK